MQFKQAIIKLNGEEFNFFFPIKFNDKPIIKSLKGLRSDDFQNWKRIFIKSEVEVVELNTSLVLLNDHKYIVVYDKDSADKEKFMVVFPKVINHDYMFETVQDIVIDSNFQDDIIPYNAFSAGFINHEGICYGASETLDLKSNKTDTTLFKTTYK